MAVRDRLFIRCSLLTICFGLEQLFVTDGIVYPVSLDNLGYIDETSFVELLMYENIKDFLKISQISLFEEKSYTWHLLVVSYRDNCYLTGLFCFVHLKFFFFHHFSLTDCIFLNNIIKLVQCFT